MPVSHSGTQLKCLGVFWELAIGYRYCDLKLGSYLSGFSIVVALCILWILLVKVMQLHRLARHSLGLPQLYWSLLLMPVIIVYS